MLITLLLILWIGLITLGCLYWLAMGLATILLVRRVRILVETKPVELKVYPGLSVIITARDEARSLENAMESRLRDEYPDVEFILVDDRSSDGTSEIIDRIARNDPRVKAMHIRDLPDGWLGKIWALNEGTKVASGEWLLFSDGDVHFEPGTLKRAISYAQSHGIDHLGLMPEIESHNFPLDIALGTFVRLLSVGARFWEVENPKSKAFMGVGAFNLVRRSAFERTPGFEWLKLEPADDAALGMMMKRAGAKSSIMGGVDLIRVRWYENLREMTHGLERTSMSAFGGYGLVRPMVLWITGLIAELAPFLALCYAGQPAVQAMGAFTTVVALVSVAVISRWASRPVLPGLLVPVGTVMMFWMFLRGVWLGYRRGGIIWRGTLYSTKMLREGHRVTIP